MTLTDVLIHESDGTLEENCTVPRVGMTNGELVRTFRRSSHFGELVRVCYWDENLLVAAQRFFNGDEFKACVRQIPNTLNQPVSILDLGGGNGVAGLAWRMAGYDVVIAEPSLDGTVGLGAVKGLNDSGEHKIHLCAANGLNLPFPSDHFDVVYTRQVLHHVPRLRDFCKEVIRILKPNGVYIATREHVLSQSNDLATFLERHPTHRFAGGENAYLLQDYASALRHSGFVSIQTIGTWENAINYYPSSEADFRDRCQRSLSLRCGPHLGKLLSRGARIRSLMGKYWTWRDRTPGRSYSFVARKAARQ